VVIDSRTRKEPLGCPSFGIIRRPAWKTFCVPELIINAFATCQCLVEGLPSPEVTCTRVLLIVDVRTIKMVKTFVITDVKDVAGLALKDGYRKKQYVDTSMASTSISEVEALEFSLCHFFRCLQAHKRYEYRHCVFFFCVFFSSLITL